jgi:hypothetical protein
VNIHWPGVYGFGLVLSVLGIIWRPEQTREFALSALLMLVSALIAMSVKRQPVHEKMEDYLYRSPQEEKIDVRD